MSRNARSILHVNKHGGMLAGQMNASRKRKAAAPSERLEQAKKTAVTRSKSRTRRPFCYVTRRDRLRLVFFFEPTEQRKQLLTANLSCNPCVLASHAVVLRAIFS